MTRTAALPVAVLLLTAPLAACGSPLAHSGGDASASCVGPAISTQPFRSRPRPGPVRVRAGQVLTIHGKFYVDGCQDTGGAPAKPYASVQLALESRYRVGPLVTVHPRGPVGSFTVRVTIPADTAAGKARIFDTRGSTGGVIRLVVHG